MEQRPAPLIHMPDDICKEISMRCKTLFNDTDGLNIFKNVEFLSELQSSLSELMDDVSAAALNEINNKTVGIFAVDFSNHQLTKLQSFSAGYCFFNNLKNPIKDEKIKLPFTLYKSSPDNENQLKNIGVKFYSPDKIMGYHNDGIVKGNAVYIPEIVGIWNIFIGYDNPGNFHWIPMEYWPNFDQFKDIFENEKIYEITLTPVVYNSHLQKETPDTGMKVNAKIFSSNAEKNLAFVNGILSDPEVRLAHQQMIESISRAPIRYYVPQKVNQLILFANQLGFHARDVLSGQRVQSGTTRAYLRMMSEDATRIN